MKAGHSLRVVVTIVIALLVSSVVFNNNAWAQAKKPITKEGLIEALRIGGLSSRALVQEIKSRGVSFEVAGPIEAELRAAGARPAVIEAVRSNYRPLVGRLNVSSSVPGASIVVSGVGNYTEKISDMKLPPGHYTITGNKFGYRPIASEVEIKLFKVSNINLRFVPLTTEEMLTMAAQSYDQSNYSAAIALARNVLLTQPNNARANALLASSLYANGEYEEVIAVSSRALKAGGAVSIPVQHRHVGKAGKALGAGNLTFRSQNLEFQSKDFADEGFLVPYSKISEMSVKDQVRLSMKVRIKLPKNRKETDEEYNFYSTDAVATGRTITCEKCLPRMRIILELLKQSRPAS